MAERDRLAIFTFLWALYSVMEQAKWDDWAKTPLDLGFSFLAWWTLVRPRSRLLLAALALAQLGMTAARLPWV